MPTKPTIPPPPPADEPEAAPSAPAPEPAANEPAVDEAGPGRYRFTGPYPQTYMNAALVAEPGESYDWPAGPPADGRWIKEN